MTVWRYGVGAHYRRKYVDIYGLKMRMCLLSNLSMKREKISAIYSYSHHKKKTTSVFHDK